MSKEEEKCKTSNFQEIIDIYKSLIMHFLKKKIKILVETAENCQKDRNKMFASMFNLADANGDGVLTFNEFCDLVHKVFNFNLFPPTQLLHLYLYLQLQLHQKNFFFFK